MRFRGRRTRTEYDAAAPPPLPKHGRLHQPELARSVMG